VRNPLVVAPYSALRACVSRKRLRLLQPTTPTGSLRSLSEERNPINRNNNH
jgi:hypothetical protein